MPIQRTRVRFHGAYLCRNQICVESNLSAPFTTFRGRLLKAHSGSILENRICIYVGPHAGSVFGAASEPESRFGMGVGRKIKKNLETK